MALGNGEAGHYVDPVQGIKDSYNRGVTDEFIVPFVCVDNRGEPLATIRDEDVLHLLQLPRRPGAADYARAGAGIGDFTPQGGRDLPDAEALDATIPRDRLPRNLNYVCMTRYDKQFTLPVVIPPESLDNILANVMAKANLRNLRVAETEKYAHVTYFFNGGVEQPFPGEEREMVPSPKVATYDLKPEMSAAGNCRHRGQAIEKGSFDVIIVNFANADMVGHSGKIPPTVKAVEAVDANLGRIYQAVRAAGRGAAGHRGPRQRRADDRSGYAAGRIPRIRRIPVPFILAMQNGFRLRSDGALQDISPTVLSVLGLPSRSR